MKAVVAAHCLAAALASGATLTNPALLAEIDPTGTAEDVDYAATGATAEAALEALPDLHVLQDWSGCTGGVDIISFSDAALPDIRITTSFPSLDGGTGDWLRTSNGGNFAWTGTNGQLIVIEFGTWDGATFTPGTGVRAAGLTFASFGNAYNTAAGQVITYYDAGNNVLSGQSFSGANDPVVANNAADYYSGFLSAGYDIAKVVISITRNSGASAIGIDDLAFTGTSSPPPPPPDNPGETLATGLAAYLTLDETGGPVDHSHYRLGSRVEGTVATSEAVFGKARGFDGNGDRIRLDPWTDFSGFPDRECLTVSLWFKAGSTTGQRVLFDDPAKHDALGARLDAGRMQVTCTRDGRRVTLEKPFTDTTSWHHLGVVKNGDSIEVFLDGASVALVPDIDTAPASSIDAGAGAPFNGEIDEVRLYRRALTAAEITELQTATALTHAHVWRGYFFSTTTNAGSAADVSDFERDGLVNLLERAFGTHPLEPDPPPARLASVDGNGDPGNGYFGMSYPRLAGGSGATGDGYTANGITYSIEHSNALGSSWSTGDITVLSIEDDVPKPGLQTVHLRLNTPLEIDSRQFLRLRVSSAE